MILLPYIVKWKFAPMIPSSYLHQLVVRDDISRVIVEPRTVLGYLHTNLVIVYCHNSLFMIVTEKKSFDPPAEIFET